VNAPGNTIVRGRVAPGVPPKRGFTLIEIMVAMAIFSLVVTAIYATWTLIIKSAKIGLESSARLQRERVAMRSIEEALGSARSFAADLSHYGFVAENGDDGTLSFVARLPESFPRGGRFGDFDVRRVTFSLESGPDARRQLVLRQTPILMDPGKDKDELEHPLVLAAGVDKMAFEFWDSQRNEWIEEWGQTNQLPKMMKVTLGFVSQPGNKPFGTALLREEVSRIIALPAVTVPVMFQRPNTPGVGGLTNRPAAPIPVNPPNSP
jgi:general secretion pathway protein J